MMPTKVYYLPLHEFLEEAPFKKYTLQNFLLWVFNLEDASGLADYQLPADMTTNATIYNELLSLIFGVYYDEDIVKIVKRYDEAAPTQEEYTNKSYEWANRLVSLLNMTYEYYMPILTLYRDNKALLMDDIVATSKNKVKFNDTPQNANTADVYEGDNYITHFTATENESKSPLATKIMRLKEIQDNYKNIMYEWVKQFEKIFYEGIE